MRVDSMERCPAWAWTASNAMPASQLSGQAGVAQHVTGDLPQTGAPLRAFHDLVESSRGQRPPATWSLEGDEYDVGASVPGTFCVEVGGDGGEESVGDRHDAFVPALARSDEQLTVGQP